MSDTMTPGATHSATLSVDAMLDELKQRNLVREDQYPTMFGLDRHKITLPRLERGIDAASVLSDSDLIRLKAKLAGLPVVPLDATPQAGLDRQLIKSAFAIQIDIGDNAPAVAVVDPQPRIIELCADALGVHPGGLSVHITSVRGFNRLFSALQRADEVAVERPLPDEIWELFDRIVTEDGSDLHLAVGIPPRLRIRGALEALEFEPVTEAWLSRALAILLPNHDIDGVLRSGGTLNPAVSFGRQRFRCVISRADNGPTLVARKLSSTIPKMDDIALPQSVRNLINLERGLVLVTGPTGSGKSTTLASMLQTLLMTQKRSVLTLEEPIEYRLRPGPSSMVYQREKGRDFTNFHDGVVTGLRQDPDVILIGEMRDDQTVRAALEAAETGHLVFGTLHTYDAGSTVGRVADFFSATEKDGVRALLSGVLEGVVSQTLLPTASGSGRVGAYEVMLKSTAISNHMRTVEGIAQIRGAMQIANREGMQTLEQDLAKLVRAQKVERAEAEFKARDKDAFAGLLDAR